VAAEGGVYRRKEEGGEPATLVLSEDGTKTAAGGAEAGVRRHGAGAGVRRRWC
jgi:hypothetical protein